MPTSLVTPMPELSLFILIKRNRKEDNFLEQGPDPGNRGNRQPGWSLRFAWWKKLVHQPGVTIYVRRKEEN